MEKFMCPIEDVECPYFDMDECLCTMTHPDEECDDYMSYMFEEE